MKKVILITGANGMLAKKLAQLLEADFEIRFLTRTKTKANEFLWDLKTNYIEPEALQNVDTIIHLAGESIADGRWTNERKKAILDSRVESAKLILDTLEKNQLTIENFISASAAGFYGTRTVETTFDETSPKGNDFLSDVCQSWEKIAKKFKTNAVANRVAIVRIGVILDKNEGALQKIIQPIQYNVGSALGSGKQYMPWIHIDDLARLFQFIVHNQNLTETYNAVAPQHINNQELTVAIANALNKKLFLPNIPGFVMKLMFGEMASILLYGSKVSSKKIEEKGFVFEYDTIEKALKNLV